MSDYERKGGVCEIINEAMRNIVREQEEFPAKGGKKGRKGVGAGGGEDEINTSSFW